MIFAPSPTPVLNRSMLPGGLSLGFPVYFGSPFAFKETRPPSKPQNHAIVSSIIVDPASAPTPTDTWSCASTRDPSPEHRIIIPSGTAPRIWRELSGGCWG